MQQIIQTPIPQQCARQDAYDTITQPHTARRRCALQHCITVTHGFLLPQHAQQVSSCAACSHACTTDLFEAGVVQRPSFRFPGLFLHLVPRVLQHALAGTAQAPSTPHTAGAQAHIHRKNPAACVCGRTMATASRQQQCTAAGVGACTIAAVVNSCIARTW